MAGREGHDHLDKVKVTKPFLFSAARQLLYVVGQQNFCMVHILAFILEGKGWCCVHGCAGAGGGLDFSLVQRQIWLLIYMAQMDHRS